MARIEIKSYRYIDDLTKAEVNTAEELEEITFAIDGHAVVLDLTGSNARHLRRQLRPYMRAARPAGLTRVKNSLQAGKPAWVEKDGLLEDPKPEPKPEAPKPPPVAFVEPPQANKPEPKPATWLEPGEDEGEKVSFVTQTESQAAIRRAAVEAKQEAGARAVTATRPAGATAVPQPTRSPEDDEERPVEFWAQWAPDPKDKQRKKGEKIRAWCRARGYVIANGGSIPVAYHGQYQQFYANTANWTKVPPQDDLVTSTGRALASAAERARQAS